VDALQLLGEKLDLLPDALVQAVFVSQEPEDLGREVADRPATDAWSQSLKIYSCSLLPPLAAVLVVRNN